ncbi:DNA polymerase zeta catalytic subunit-like [Chenopodium quinoa]|uniref:DNA polymerase zeta catalytic subunit-like n=1 Tax=Chenopodium quinoa TaxID=63459 RepID=UPI000B76D4B6|nr:DNA polymerase zeta catalytic subunit-like [Chenopodium quinoa]
MEEPSSQGDSKVFSVRIVSIDHYMSPPIPDFDISYSSFQGGSVKEVPVIRIFGSTPAGQKACVHVHRALPYLYVPCSDIPLHLNPEGSVYVNVISFAVEKALKLKGNAGTKRQHVHSCTVVRAKKFYGYHLSEELFVKINLYYPHDVSRAANLLLSGVVFEKCLQPYESHIPFLLQFLVDYNLYGMGHMHVSKMKFRHPVPGDLHVENADRSNSETFVGKSSYSQSDVASSLHSLPLVWRSLTIPDEWMWQYPSIRGASSTPVNNFVNRQSICELEGDATVEDILNQQLKMYTSLSQTRSDVRMVQSLVPIWEEEFERIGVHDAEILADPGRPPPQDVLKTLSNGVEYMDNLKGLYSKLESNLLDRSEDVKSMVPTQCPIEEESIMGTRNQNSNELVLRSSEDVNIEHCVTPHQSVSVDAIGALLGKSVEMDEMDILQVMERVDTKGTDSEDVALLKWLASSQAAVDMNSDDELHQETILNPMLPAATIDKVLKIANTDYENGSQQECQDILDSIVDVLNSDDQKGKRTSIGQDLSGSKIPKFDGAGDDHQFTPAANLPEQIDTESVSSKHHTFPHCSSSFDDKQKKPKLQFGHQLTPAANLPEKMDTESVSSKRHTFPHSSSSFDDKQKKSKLQFGPLPLSEVQQFTTNIHSDPSTKNADGSGCYVVDSRTQHSGSVRDLMRKKQSFRVGSSSSGKSVEEGFVKENNVFYPRKLEFHTEPSEEQNLMAAEFSPSSHMQIDKQTEVCEVRQSATDCPVGKEKQDIANSSVADAEVVKVDSVKQHASVSPPFAFGHMDETESVGYISMTFHKKPPLASWKNGTSQNSASIPVPSRWCSVKDDSDDEGTSVQGGVPEDVHPFFTDSSKSVSQESHGFGIGVPTHYYNDGSYAYLLTPAVSPPSVDSVFNWLALEEKERTRAKPLPDDSSELTLLEPMNNRLDGENHRNLDMEGGLMKDELAQCLDKGSSLKEIFLTKLSHDISQISGPSGQSKPTPLSQIGFRDPASVGAGQQLTLLSMEVRIQGDLRPDPRHDSINIIVIAVQNDSSPSVDIYALLHGSTEGCGRNLDGISGCRMLVYPEERDLLDKFISITCSIDPDILIGWDIQGNSLGFLAERASHLGLSLINKISRTPAERKAVNRDLDTSDKGTAAAVSADSLMSDTVLDDNTIIEDEWGRTHASGVHVTGRIVLNVWRLVRSEVKLNMYSLEAVAEAVLRRKVPSIHWKILNKWFSSGPGRARFRCIEYFVERVKLNFDIVNQLDMINRTSELARVFGIDFFSVLSRGSQYRVESMLVRLAHTQNYVLISPGYQQVASQPAMECIPLVMEPESGFYSDPVVVLDFQSLYPSMIIAYNLCFSTCLGNVVPSKADCLGVSSYSPDLQILKDLNQQILVTPNGVMYVPSEVRKGILPRLLEEILSTRVMVKQAMKSLAPSQQVLQRIFNARQLALKLIANVTYGYTAAGFSGRMPCAELADSIVQCGRKTLEHAILFVNKHDQWNARVLYGDTDSMFVLLKGRTLKEAFRIGNEIASTITAMNPNPVKLKMEKVYQSCFLLTKKRYVGYSYESLSQPEPMFDAKGIETVRRDTCPAVAKTLEKSLRMFFECQDISKVKAYLQRQWSRILSGRISIQDFVFAKEVRLGTYSTRASSSLPPAAIVASKAMRVDPRAEPRYAERVLYVVVHGEPGARLVDMVVDPQELLSMESPYRLNDLYYITKQIIPALQRVFGLIGADLRQWFQDMPRPVRDAPAKQHFSAVNSLRARIDYYYSSKHCVLCGELVQTANYFCEKCSKKGPVTVAAMTGRTLKLERDIQHLVAICRHCGGGDWLVESGVKCTSLACSVYYERQKVQKELRAFSGIATEAGFYPKCMVEWF